MTHDATIHFAGRTFLAADHFTVDEALAERDGDTVTRFWFCVRELTATENARPRRPV